MSSRPFYCQINRLREMTRDRDPHLTSLPCCGKDSRNISQTPRHQSWRASFSALSPLSSGAD